MLDLLNWLINFAKEKPWTITICALLGIGYYFAPKILNISETANKTNIQLLQKINEDCRSSQAAAWHLNDSLRGVIQVERNENANEKARMLESNNEDLRILVQKYKDGARAAQKVTQTIDNIQKKVNHEISN